MKTIQSVSTNDFKIVVGRMLPGVDLIQGIKEICEKNKVRFGVISTGIGSLSKSGIVYAIPDEKNKMGLRYSEPTYFEGPLELLGCQGMVGEDEEGEFQIHLHGLMGDKDLKIIGGHFLPDENKVLVTVEITVIEVSQAQFIRQYDEDTEFELFNFYSDRK